MRRLVYYLALTPVGTAVFAATVAVALLALGVDARTAVYVAGGAAAAFLVADGFVLRAMRREGKTVWQFAGEVSPVTGGRRRAR